MANDDIDDRAEGETPPHEKDDRTNAGYDEAAHSGPNRYGVPEGEGGVFGTTGGGTPEVGFHIEDRDSGKTAGNRGVTRKPPSS
ncbi:MAG TPA: hypothetical protein VLV78_06210 [Thermoanaerobaculia bacterium]|nr:hypothetical protein [Thermoanaerobaculia bacterium]